jgi:hypothetical protein
MTLPEPFERQPEFRRRGIVVIPDALNGEELSAIVDVATEAAKRFAVAIDRRTGGDRLSYSVVTGDHVRSKAQPLFDLYNSPHLLEWIRSVTDDWNVSVSPHMRSAININCLSRRGQRYPKHTDAVPYTALLFLSTLDASDGGDLLVDAADGDLVTIQPQRGLFLLMDGNRCPHAVAPLRTNAMRVTVPMVYPARVAPRPAGLDDYLYAAAEHPAP